MIEAKLCYWLSIVLSVIFMCRHPNLFYVVAIALCSWRLLVIQADEREGLL